MAGGRPSEYKPEYCDVVIECGKNGDSITQMAVACDVVKDTLKDWSARYPEFSVAFSKAKELSQTWWENKAKEHLVELPGGAKINSGLWGKIMAARFPAEYRDNSKVELTGADGGAIQTSVTVEFVKSGEAKPS